MQVTVTIRRMDDQAKAEYLRDYVLKKLKRVRKYITPKRNPSEVRVVLSVEKFRSMAEILVNSGTFKITSSVESEDMHGAIDKAIDGTIKQLKKQTDKKIKTKRRGSGKSKENTSGEESESPGWLSRDTMGNIQLEKVPSKPMSVEEAVLQFKVSGEDLLTFRNSETGEINALQRRRGGKVVLITP